MALFDNVLLTVDFDRTLTGPDGQIPQRNLDAIHYFMNNGGSFTVNTGRSLNTMRAHLDTIPVNAPYLLFNGSASYQNGKFVYTNPIDMDMWQTLKVVLAEFPQMNLEVQALDTHYLIDPKPEYEAFYKGMGWDYKVAHLGDDLGPFIKFALFGKPYISHVATMFEATQEEKDMFDAAQARIESLWGDKVVVFRAAPRIVDVHAKGVSKINAARDLQKKLGKSILVCVGDAENDLPMLYGADYAFCPADGVVADLFPNVCVCANGAVADVIYKKIPEILGFSIDKPE